MATSPSLADAEAQLRRVREHIEELRRAGRNEDAEAVRFVRDLAEQALARPWTAQPRDLLTTGQTGQALGLSTQTVRKWIAAGRLPAVKRGVRTLIPRQAVLEEIERSRVRPSGQATPTSEDAAAHRAWRRELLTALPQEIVGPLDELHEKLESGDELSPAEQAEMVRLEREMIDAASHHLKQTTRRRAGSD